MFRGRYWGIVYIGDLEGIINEVGKILGGFGEVGVKREILKRRRLLSAFVF